MEANGGCWDETGPKNLCSRSRCCWLATYGLITFNALRLSVWSNFKVVPSVCTHLCLPVSEKKSLFGPPKEYSPPPFSPLRSLSLPAHINRPSADYWSMNLYNMIITICFSSGIVMCLFNFVISCVCLFLDACATANTTENAAKQQFCTKKLSLFHSFPALLHIWIHHSLIEAIKDLHFTCIIWVQNVKDA